MKMHNLLSNASIPKSTQYRSKTMMAYAVAISGKCPNICVITFFCTVFNLNVARMTFQFVDRFRKNNESVKSNGLIQDQRNNLEE